MDSLLGSAAARKPPAKCRLHRREAPGTLGRAYIEGPGHIKFDLNMKKSIRIDETKNFEIRIDVIDILNTPYWNNPTVDINSVNFGRMDAADVTTGLSNADNRSANRKFTFTARLNF